MPKKNHTPIKHLDNFPEKIQECTICQPTHPKDTSAEKFSHIKARAVKLVDKLLDKKKYSEGAQLLKELKATNFIVHKIITTEYPPFFNILVAELLSRNVRDNDFNLLFKLECLQDKSLLFIHQYLQEYIIEQVDLKTLFYYLSNHPSRLPMLFDEGRLHKIIMGSQSKHDIKYLGPRHNDIHDLSHFFRLICYLPHKQGELLCSILSKNMPHDFIWPGKYQNTLKQMNEYLNALVGIEKDYEVKLKKLEASKSFDIPYNPRILIEIFYSTVCQQDTTYLNQFIELMCHLTLPYCLEHTKLLYDSLNAMTTSWLKYHNQYSTQINKNTVIIESVAQQLSLFNAAIKYWDKKSTKEQVAIQVMLKGIVLCHAYSLKQVFFAQLNEFDEPIGRKECAIISLIDKLRPIILKMHQKGRFDLDFREEGTSSKILEELEKHFKMILEKPSFKIYFFEKTQAYQAIKTKALDWLTELLPHMEQLVFDAINDGNRKPLEHYIDTIQDEHIKKNAMGFVFDVCAKLHEIGATPKHILDLKGEYCAKLDLFAYHTSLELILERQDMMPVLLAEGVTLQDIEFFYRALYHRNFSGNPNAWAQIAGIAKSKNLLVISYIHGCLNYYAGVLPMEHKAELQCVKQLIKKFEKQLSVLSQEKKNRFIKKDPICELVKNPDECRLDDANSKSYKENLQMGALIEAPSFALEHDDPVHQMRRFAKASRKMEMFTLYIHLLTAIRTQFDGIKGYAPVNKKAIELDELNFDNRNRRITNILSSMLEKQHAILSEFPEQKKGGLHYSLDEKTAEVKKWIESGQLKTMMDCFYAHNQLITALYSLIHLINKKFHTKEEIYLIDNVNEFLLISYAGLSQKQFDTLSWLKQLITSIEQEARKIPMFQSTQCFEAGFIQAGVYGSFIAKKFAKDVSRSRVEYESDIDCVYYFNQDKVHIDLTLHHMLALQQIMHGLLPPEAQARAAIVSDGVGIWHGFSYGGQECDISLRKSPPIPVFSHSSIFYRLNDNSVKFLANGQHALLHIARNRLNIIAPTEQHTESRVMAHVLKKLFTYLDNGVQLTSHSKNILSHLLSNEDLANEVIAKFISSSHQDPVYYCGKFLHTPLDVKIREEDVSITLAEYMMRQVGIAHPEHLHDFFEKIDMLQLFSLRLPQIKPQEMVLKFLKDRIESIKSSNAEKTPEPDSLSSERTGPTMPFFTQSAPKEGAHQPIEGLSPKRI